MQSEPVPVVFRKFHGEIIALFPTLKWDLEGKLCTAYTHYGQHGEADYEWVMANSISIGFEQYQELYQELSNLVGYNLIIEDLEEIRALDKHDCDRCGTSHIGTQERVFSCGLHGEYCVDCATEVNLPQGSLRFDCPECSVEEEGI